MIGRASCRVMGLEAVVDVCLKEARDLVVGQHHDLDLRNHRPHDAPDDPCPLAPDHEDALLALQQAALEARNLSPPGQPAHEQADAHSEVEQEDDAPEPHQCTCSAGGSATTVSWLSARISASSTLMSDQPGAGPPGVQRA